MNSYSAEFFRNTTGTSAAFAWPGGEGFFFGVATFGGGFIDLQYVAPDGTTWLTLAANQLTANGGSLFKLPPCQIRAVANTATACYVMAARIPY